MRPAIFGFITIFLSLYSLVNYYVGLRSWQTVFSRLTWLTPKLYWITFWAIALSYLVGRVTRGWLTIPVSKSLTIVGAYWLAILFYLVLAWTVVDILRFLNRWLHFIPESVTGHPYYLLVLGSLVLVVVAGTVGYGVWNARNPIVKNYTVTIPKQAGQLKQLQVVAVSDIHLGEIMDLQRLRKLVNTVNGLKPDLILLPGDVIDEDVGPFIQQKMSEVIRGMHAPYGIIAIPGNHEYIGGQGEEVIAKLREAGITVLRDETTRVADSVYIIGRDDPTRARFGGQERKELSEILQGVDKTKPLILLDHQPKDLGEAQQQHIDLQLSGHTHRGQLWPNNYLTQRIYELDWGYLRKGDLQAIVSLGYGTWGPPVRVGNNPEIVNINLQFE